MGTLLLYDTQNALRQRAERYVASGLLVILRLSPASRRPLVPASMIHVALFSLHHLACRTGAISALRFPSPLWIRSSSC